MKLLNHSFILRYSNPPFSDLLEMLFLFPPLGNLACLAQLPVFVKENSFICIVGFPLAVCNDDKAFLNSKHYNLQFYKVFLGNLKVLTIWSSLWCTPGTFVSFAGQACAESLSSDGHHSLDIRSWLLDGHQTCIAWASETYRISSSSHQTFIKFFSTMISCPILPAY